VETKSTVNTLRIAVVGVGAQPRSRARQYLSTINRLSDHYELAAVCDRSPDALQQVASQFGVESVYRDVRSLLESEKPDVVLSLTPKDSHIVMALTAARNGAHVITEIPVALTRRYAEAIARTCKENEVLWEVAEQVWLWPQERLKKRIIESGRLGKVTHARLSYLTGQYHGFNGIRELLGSEATRVLGYCGEVETEPYTAYGGEPESTVKWETAIIEFATGAVCLFEKPPRIFPSSPHSFPVGWQIEGTRGNLDRNRLTLYGPDHSDDYEILEKYVQIEGERVLEGVRVDTNPPVEWKNPFKRYRIGTLDDIAIASILTSFHQAITDGGRPQYGYENGIRDWELSLAVRESARLRNSWVTLPLGQSTQLERQIEAEFVRRYGHDPIEETDALLDAPFSQSATLWPFAHWL
jgi:predicted dehydrogenase